MHCTSNDCGLKKPEATKQKTFVKIKVSKGNRFIVVTMFSVQNCDSYVIITLQYTLYINSFLSSIILHLLLQLL